MLSTKIKRLEAERSRLDDQISESKTAQKIKCASCGKFHALGGLTAVQTYWTDSDSDSHRGELQFLCPKTGIRNRLLFNNNDVPWPERKDYKNNPEDQFILTYSGLFGKTQRETGEQSSTFVNNYYVDENRSKFGLVEKRK